MRDAWASVIRTALGSVLPTMTSPTPSKSVTPPRQLTTAVAIALGIAGVIHLLLTPEHMEISVVFGAGFLAAGTGQLGIAAMAVLRPSRLVYGAIIATTLGLIGLYTYNVVVGLPFHGPAVVAATDELASDRAHGHPVEAPAETHALSGTHDHQDAGVTTGTAEPMDPYGVMTQVAQLSAVALALVLLLRRPPATAERATASPQSVAARRDEDKPPAHAPGNWLARTGKSRG